MTTYADYTIEHSFDLMLLFGDLAEGVKRDFLIDGIRDLDYGDDLIVVEEGAKMLDDCHQEALIKKVFDSLSFDDDRLAIVTQLIDKLTLEQREQLRRELNG